MLPLRVDMDAPLTLELVPIASAPTAPLAVAVEPPEPPAPLPPAPPVDPRRVAIDEAVARLRARLQSSPASPANTDDTLRDAPPPDDLQLVPPVSSDAPALEERVFVFRQRPKPAERAALVSLLARRLEGNVLRSGRFEAAAGDDHLFGRVDKDTVTVAFTGAAARGRWLSIVQQIADEHDLAEPE